jgi:DNA invertase Pin-like site-specific DNA recombinase
VNGSLAQPRRSLQRCRLKQAQLAREAEGRLEEYVRRARAAGASWQAIGAAIGITRQSAWERFRHLSAGPAKGATASRPPPAPIQRPSRQREVAGEIEGYVRRMRAAGASWQAIGTALGITRQSAWERFRHLSAGPAKGEAASQRPQPAPRYSPKRRRRDTEALVVQRLRAAGASWQAIGTALGITRQSAWERFRHICASHANIPEAVLQARHLQPDAFNKWVTEAAKTDMQVKKWLETPNIDLSAARGDRVAVPPINLLVSRRSTTALRTFLMVAAHDSAAPVPPPESVTCPICGRSYRDDDYLRRHKTSDHPAIGRKATIQ